MDNTVLSNLESILITNPTNIRYLTGFIGAGGEREAYCLLAQEQLFLFTNALYREEAQKLTKNAKNQKRLNLLKLKGLTFIEISRENPIGKELKQILFSVIPGLTRNPSLSKTGSLLPLQGKRGRDDKVRLEFEENDLTVAEYNKLKKELKEVTLVPTKNRIEDMRMIKREDEIANIKEAAKLTDQCFDFILGKLTPASAKASAGKAGVTEGEIAWEIESFFRTGGASLAFSPIVAFGKNSSMPHYQPQSSLKRRGLFRLQAQDVVLLDFGAKVNGYCADMTRVVFIGKPKEEWEKAYITVLEAQRAALEYLTGSRPVIQAQGPALSSQLSGAKADGIAREVIEKAGLPAYPHSLGHAVGLDIHEAPRLTIKKDQALKPNMVITVEPAVYVEGEYGIRIEDLILLKKDDIEVLSKSQKALTTL